MADLLVRPHPPGPDGVVVDITPASAGWHHVGFAVHRLEPGATVERATGGREHCLVAVSGTMDVRVGDWQASGVGGRPSPFADAAPGAVYVPPGATWTVTARDALELAVASAPAEGRLPVRLLDPASMSTETRGTGTNVRHVRNILPETEPAESLLVVEVITPGGHWSSYPPHKHDTDRLPAESSLEETYYHRLDPPQGFAFQRVYTDPGPDGRREIDETMTVHDGDVVLVPRGYHPVGAPHGYDLYYLNVMAGPERIWRFHNDPAHEWMLAGT
ncbi:MAG: 5-deoxy-glucuronate isomerase [Actinomyces sp.]|nr:MAG: 5-deoxy-glucuronate isomerase [Actinomyces sp.]